MSRLWRFDAIEADAIAILGAFCARFSPGVVSLRADDSLYLTPQRPGAAAVHVTVHDGAPTVIIGIGRGAVLEWQADLDTYEPAWWQAHVEPILVAVAAGHVTQLIWREGDQDVAVTTRIQLPDRLLEFTCREGLRGCLSFFIPLRGFPDDPSERIDYLPWSDT